MAPRLESRYDFDTKKLDNGREPEGGRESGKER